MDSNSTHNHTSHNQTEHSFTSDPFLQYQPNFARSLPVQLLITGVVLTLTTTLLVQLCFTWQYHWPLARINWILQITGVCTLLLNIISILWVVLSALSAKSKEWPYMFEYIAIDVPRTGSWSIPEIAAWYVMEATTSALASITHIQFLTFLYPSRLEARLVFILLGSLSVVASIMTLLPISTYCMSDVSNSTSSSSFNISAYNNTSPFNTSTIGVLPNILANLSDSDNNDNGGPSKRQQLLDVFEAARNICNLTLSLLFTLSLLIWGFLINRDSAWRTDGGTAAFGIGAILLALVSTGLNFINVVTSPHLAWLSPLLWSVVLWQSFLGWWWWVGSASGIAAREFDSEERGRKEQKRAKRKRRKVAEGEDEGLLNSSGGKTGRLERWRSSVGVTLSRRRPPAQDPVPSSQSQTSTLQDEAIELTPVSSHVTAPRATTATTPSSSSAGLSISPPRAPWYSPHFLSTAWRTLRQAHVRAARVQAFEQRQIQIQMELANGRGLGRFPGGTGGERDRGVLRSDGSDGEGPAQDAGAEGEQEGEPETRKPERQKGEEGTMWWWGPLRKWRLRDSTMY